MRRRVKERLEKLRDQPRGPGTLQLKERADHRVRVGRFRVLYLIRDETREILVTRIVRRNEATY